MAASSVTGDDYKSTPNKTPNKFSILTPGIFRDNSPGKIRIKSSYDIRGNSPLKESFKTEKRKKDTFMYETSYGLATF